MLDLALKALTFFIKNLGDQSVYFNLKAPKTSYSALSDSFEYLCHGSTNIRNIFNLTVRRSTLVVRI